MAFGHKFDKFSNQTGRWQDCPPFDSWKVFLITPSSWQKEQLRFNWDSSAQGAQQGV